MAKKEKKWGWAITALLAILLASGFSLLTLFPDWQLQNRFVAYLSMSFSVITVLWPLAVLLSLVALLRSSKLVSILLVLISIAGTYWFVKPFNLEKPIPSDTAIEALVVHYQGDSVALENLVKARSPEIVQVIGVDDAVAVEFSQNELASQYPNVLFQNGVLVLSSSPLSVQAEYNNLLVASAQFNEENWTFAFIDFPTPLDDVVAWQSSAKALSGMISPHRSGNLVVLGSAGNNRFSAPFKRLETLGLIDTRIQARAWDATSWPLNSVVRPIFTFDHAFVSRTIVASDYQRISFGNDDYQGFSVSLAPKQK